MPTLRGTKPNGPDTDALAAIVKLFSQQRYEEVISTVRVLTSRYPEDGFGWKALGLAYKYTGHPDALMTMEKAVFYAPCDADAHSNLGNLLQECGQFEAAEASLRRALALDVRHIAALNNLALVLHKQLRHTEAKNYLQCALQINPNYYHAWSNLGQVLHALRYFDEAVICFRKAINGGSEDINTINSLGSALQESGKLDEAVECYQQVLERIQDHVGALCNLGIAKQEMLHIDETRQHYAKLQIAICKDLPKALLSEDGRAITALLPFGRSGSLFLHSLLDGHPDIVTLPGIYFKGWFAVSTWQRFAPDLRQKDWREALATKILQSYAPLFDAHIKKNVPGSPMDSTWLARDLGLTKLGPNKTLHLKIDQDKFRKIFIDLLRPLDSLDPRQCFELIHQAWMLTMQSDASQNTFLDKHLFFHLHNPNALEMASFKRYYPGAHYLYIVRSPLQSMESWLLMDLMPSGAQQSDARDHPNACHIRAWQMIVSKIIGMLTDVFSPLNDSMQCRGLRLEDVKRSPIRALSKLANWMEIPDHPALYESSFCGMQYWGPTSNLTGNITGFDTRPIETAVGRFLGERDIKIFETLFWPFSHAYSYTTLDEGAFRQQLLEIQPWLTMPFDFEVRLYDALPDHSCALVDLAPYRRLHQYVQRLYLAISQGRVGCGIMPLLWSEKIEGAYA